MSDASDRGADKEAADSASDQGEMLAEQLQQQKIRLDIV